MDSFKDMAESMEDEDLEDIDMSDSSDSKSENQDLSGSGNSFSFLKDIIGAEPPPKGLEQYKDHALNFSGKDSIAKILRGMEGIVGNLNKAVVLIALGVIELYNERTEAQTPDNVGGIEKDGTDPEH